MTTSLEHETRQELKDLIDFLPACELLGVKRYLQYIQTQDDPVERLLANAPLDDEEVTDEDLAAFADTDEDFRTGNTYTQEEVERELGLYADIREDAK